MRMSEAEILFEVKDGLVFAIREYMDSLYVSRLFEKKS